MVLAVLWTLLIFILCFLPANDLPEVDVPFADKWVHFILFGVFSFLWLFAIMGFRPKHYVLVMLGTILLGGSVEELQGILTFLGRSKDYMDMLADTVGGFLGSLLYYVLSTIAKKHFVK